jgi:hypothetical protein
MDPNADPTPKQPASELYRYGGSTAVVEMFKTPGDALDLAAMSRRNALDPLTGMGEGGAIVIMTRSAQRDPATGHHHRSQYVTDGRVVAEWKDGGHYQVLSTAAPLAPITIGEKWQDPFDSSEAVVDWVMQPHNDAAWADESDIKQKPEMPYSPPQAARDWLAQAVHSRH